MIFKARFVLAGELEVIENGVVEVDDEGVVVGVGKYTGGGSVADLGRVALVPQLVNGHVHVLDAIMLDRDDLYIDDLVGWPHGVKYISVRRLVERGRHVKLLEEVARRMRSYGTGCALVYAEFAPGDVQEVFERFGIKAIVFAEAHGDFPQWPYVQVASPVDHPPDYLRELRRRYQLVSSHVSETADCHEAGDLELALRVLEADVLVHLVHVTPEEISAIPPDKAVVVNPRANAYFVGKVAPVPELLALRPLIGTDNVFMNEPDLWAEMKFLHAYAAERGWQLSARDILSMATVWGYRAARGCPPIQVGMPLRALAVAAPYDGDVLKFLVKRTSHRDLLAFIEGRSVVPL